MTENTADDNYFGSNVYHNGLVYDCYLKKCAIPSEKGSDDFDISVAIPAAQVTEELLSVLTGVEYIEINDGAVTYHIDNEVPRYVRRGDIFELQYSGSIANIHMTAE